MLNILIADQDTNNLKSIKSYIDKNFIQFDVIKVVSEKKEFLKFFKSHTVELIILEIRFLGINPIQEIKEFSENNPNTKFIVYGNLSDIEYLEKTLQIGSISYAIRPVKPSDLKKCLNSAQEYFKSIDQFKKEEKMLAIEYLQNFKVFENRFLSLLINEAIFEKDEIENSFNYFNISITSPYRVGVVRIDNFRKYIITKDQKEKHRLIFKILKTIEKNISNAKAFINLFNEIVIIFGGDNDLDNIIQILNEIKFTIKEKIDLNVSCGLGRVYENANQINTSFLEANTALRYRCIVGYNSVIPLDYVEPKNTFSAKYPYKIEKDFVYTAVIGEYEYCLILLNRLYKEIKFLKLAFDKIIPQVIFSIVLSINRLAFEQGLEIEDISNFFPTKDILKLKDKEQAYNFLKTGTEKFCVHVTKLREDIKENIFNNAINYINENYFKNITYKSLSKQLNCNYKYFKKLFDVKTEKNLPDYISKIRIDKAKKMILETTLTDDIIALKLGFEDVASFRKTFKALEGCLVGDFRYINKDLKKF